MLVTRDGLFRFLCSFFTKYGDAYKIGTGIFVCSPSREGRSYGWIVTANHVAMKTNSHTLLYFSDENGKTVERMLSLFGDVKNWKHHPTADISALPIYFDEKNRNFLLHKFVPLDHFCLQRTPISRDCELTLAGFPNGYGLDVDFSPFTVRSYPTSGLLRGKRLDTGGDCEFFCLENPSAKGYSGGPVMDLGYSVVGGKMVTHKENSLVYGILHGTLSDDTGGKIAMVTPSYYLADLIPNK